MVVISPHLDDAALSCGDLLAAHPGSTVVTVFAGMPPRARNVCTEWDTHCGFCNAEEALTRRRQEDRRALSVLEARPCWLEFCDSQYGDLAGESEIQDRLRRLLLDLGADRVVIPLGLYHSDHLLTHAASLKAVSSLKAPPFLAYEDIPYRAMRGVLEQRLSTLLAMGIKATPARLTNQLPVIQKQEAIQAYASQLRGLGADGCADAKRPECYWHLTPTS